MVGNVGPVGAVVDLIREDLAQNGPQSGFCQYLEFVEELSGGFNAGVRLARQRFCNPPDLPPAEIERFEAGGDPCKLYDVTVQGTNNTTGEVSTSVLRRNGPIRLNRYRAQNPPNRYVGRDELLGGDGVSCLATRDLIIGFDNIIPEATTGRIISIVPVDGTPDTNTPFPVNPPPPYPPSAEPFPVDITVNLGGQQINVPLVFAPVIPVAFAPVIPVFVGVNPDFNLNLDLNFNPRFQVGVDLNLSFGIELDGSRPQPVPVPGVEPVERPPFLPEGGGDCEEFDYERIEDFILAQRCCKPITNVVAVGTFTFEGLNDVAFFDVPANAVAVFIGIVPGENARAYKLAGANSEYGHGNASLVVRGNALGFERLYVNNHVLFYPEESDQKGLRVSCGKGTIVNITAGLYVPVEEM